MYVPPPLCFDSICSRTYIIRYDCFSRRCNLFSAPPPTTNLYIFSWLGMSVNLITYSPSSLLFVGLSTAFINTAACSFMAALPMIIPLLTPPQNCVLISFYKELSTIGPFLAHPKYKYSP